MSTSMFAKIPKLTCSTDYCRWAQTITTYLGVQKAWKTNTKTAPVYIKVEGGDDNQAELDAWEEAKGVARGVIILSLHPTIVEGVDVSLSVPKIWKALKDKYSAPGPSGIYAEFQKVLALEVPRNADPAHSLKAVRTAFTKLDTLKCPVPEKIQVMMLLSKLQHPI